MVSGEDRVRSGWISGIGSGVVSLSPLTDSYSTIPLFHSAKVKGERGNMARMGEEREESKDQPAGDYEKERDGRSEISTPPGGAEGALI